ncbi:RagB/SusD domain-containing protein [Zunongwangia atlantica 22II14-10F7]|uniref:RagB/SusD domain-containing protein n=2 Tax=Zunongwangia TaxID=417127 RepID=A0A1Y1T0V3_9FLAO|nr:RagB/SusD domain-containing protein [Zunongwangia atlantica 22II14-10F7]
MNNKKYIILSLMSKSAIVALLLLFASCNEENVLDLEPYNQISEDAAFSTPGLIELSVTGMYNAAQRGDYGGNGRGYPFGAAFVQQGDNRGEDVVNVATFYQLTYTATYDQTTANNVYYWSDTYRLINRANIILDGVSTAVENGVIDAELGDEYSGEAYFMRAISHLELMFHFARPYDDTPDAGHLGVPYRDVAFTTEANIADGLMQGRNTVAENYTRILEDLDMAESLLPTRDERGGTAGLIRATQEAAIAFKVRAYLHMNDWDMVLQEGERLMGVYSLTETPGVPFESGYSNSESIFSIENTANNNPGVNAALASQYNRRGLVVVSPIIWRDSYWLEDDLRREEGSLISTRSGVKYTLKYKDDVTYTDPSPVIRFAETVLSMAEASARLGQTDDAIEYLNMVRDRALANPATQSYTASDFANTDALVEAIIAERRIEFLMEGRRWPDIHRLQNDQYIDYDGIPQKYANSVPNAEEYELGTPFEGPYGVQAVPYSDYRFLWPIPQQEVNNNPTLAEQQNPGW